MMELQRGLRTVGGRESEEEEENEKARRTW